MITKKSFKNALLWIWQFPQNILALFIELILFNDTYRKAVVNGNTIIVSRIFISATSLGKYIFITDNTKYSTIIHECGHSKQSIILGPLYLLVIGIPSLLHNIIHTLCGKVGIKWDYYSFYTESWANRLVQNIK